MSTIYPNFHFNNLESAAPFYEPQQEWSDQLTCSHEEQPITPKDVLRQTIRINMQLKGQEIPIIEKVKVGQRRRRQARSEELSEELLQRREKNRDAARKCRMKRKKTLETLEQKTQKYRNWNMNMEREIHDLHEEKAKLQQLLHNHKCTAVPRMVMSAPPQTTSSSPPMTETLQDEDCKMKSIQDLLEDLPLDIYYV